MLLARARALGHPTLNGLGMLIYQAIFALEEFTDSKIDAQKVLPAVKTALDEAMKVWRTAGWEAPESRPAVR